MQAFKEKVAVITGAASGIGRALASRCAQAGMRVVLADVEAVALAKAEAELRGAGADVLAVLMEAKVMTGEKRTSKRKGMAGVIFVGCLMLGFAVGFATGNIVAGLFGGLGVGFIAMGIAYYVAGEW